MKKKKLVVIGGGAAGFFCAINAAQLNTDLEVIIVEKTSKLLGKVKVSGGGRCNVTHACYSIADMIKKYPRGGAFLKKSFHHFFTTDTIAWFKSRNIILKTEADGRMFPITDSSQTIIDCFMKEVNTSGVEILMNRDVKNISKKNLEFEIMFADGKTIVADYICIACGGFPKAMQFNWLHVLGHRIVEPVPSLFTFNMPGNSVTELMGVVAENVSVKIFGTKFCENGPLLITHWGMSGPAILKLSAMGAVFLAQKNYEFIITVNWVPEYNEQTIKERILKIRFELATQKMMNRNPFALPQRLWQYLLQQCSIHEDIRWADLPAKEQNKLVKILCTNEFSVKGKTTFKDEFVTSGGIDLNEVDYNTMQSKIMPNLYFAGEVIDVDGITGGFNFQNAWTTGFIAAKAIAEKV